MTRSETFSLADELAKPSFTPARRDAPALVELIVSGAEPVCTRAASALAALGEPGRRAIEARLGESNDARLCDTKEHNVAHTVAKHDAQATEVTLEAGAYARLVAALGKLAVRGDAIARAAVIAQLATPSPRVRRAAIGALGHLCPDTPRPDDTRDIHDALIARWDADGVPLDERRALTDALGKLGGSAARQRLSALDAGNDRELARRRGRALLIVDRTASRDAVSEVIVDAAPGAPLAVRLTCKSGLAPLLADELRALRLESRANRDDAVDIVLAQPWSTLFASRLWITAGIRVARPAAGIAAGIVAQRDLLVAWTRGPVRWRLEVPDGKQRALIWRVAREVSERAPALVNDPSSTTWDIVVEADALEFRPRRVVDPRFAYRVAEVPAASHPTVAAALARLGEARPDDRVWDPFVGSGLELIERAKLGPARSFTGNDIAIAAIAAARENLAAAAVSATLVVGDARAAPGERDLDLVITNPPLGSRVKLDAISLLAATLPVMARRLAPGGRFVWITPARDQTSPVAERLQLRRSASIPVDLGGVRGHLERWNRPAT